MKCALKKWNGMCLLAALCGLSGLLVAGTLPADYTAVDYLESTGSQYVNTEYIHTATTKVVCVANIAAKQYSNYAELFGVRKNSYAANAFTFYSKFGSSGSCWNRSGQQTAGTAVATGTKVAITCEGKVASWTGVDDPSITGSITTTGTADGGISYLYIFGANKANVALGNQLETPCTSVMKLYSFQIYEGETLMRDFAPCVSPDGRAGLYDFVEAKFHPGLGDGRFLLPGETELWFARGWIESATGANQWLDTGYQPQTTTRIETLVHPYARSSNWASLFGVMKNDTSANGVLMRYYYNENKLNGFFCNNTYTEAQIAITPDTDLEIVLKAGSMSVNGEVKTITTVNAPYASSLYIFGENNNGSVRRCQNARFQTFRIYEGDTLTRDYVPCWRAGQEVSFHDLVAGGYCPSKATLAFTCWGELSYVSAGTKLTAYDGRLLASDLAGRTALEKAGPLALNVSNVTTLPDVTVSGGVLSFQDGVAATHTAGAVSFAGCRRLEVDLAGACVDTLTATSLTLPASGTIVLAVVGTVTEAATCPVLVAPGVDLARFTLDASGLLGGSARLVSDGANTLSVIVANDTMPYTYKGPATNTVWGDAAQVWQDNLGATVAWANGADAVFDGTGAAGAVVNDAITAGTITFNRNADFTLAGTGTVGGNGTVTKNGSGTLTLNGANFDQQNLVINAGRVVLGADAGLQSLGGDSGSGAGTVTVNAGGQFNLNYIGTAANSTDVRQEITQLKTFRIAGDGADHRGALVNDALDGREVHNSIWSASFRRIELADDATIGGLDRVDLRVRTGTAATATPGIYGPGKNLTIKNTGYFGLVSQPIEVEKVTLTDGGVFRPEGLTEAQITIPGGLTLDNGTLHAYQTTWPAATALDVTAKGGEINGQTGTTTFKGPVTLAEGGELRLAQTASSSVFYAGGFANHGTVKTLSGNHSLTAGALAGDGLWDVSGGVLFWYGALDLGKDRTVSLSGGTFSYGKETDDVAPLNHKVTVQAAGGEVAVNVGKACTITSDNLAIAGQPARVTFYSRNDDTTYVTLKDFTADASGLVLFGGNSNGRYVLDSGTALIGKEFYLNGNGKIADVTVRQGASVTSGTFAKIGNSNATTAHIVVDGGTFSTTGNNWIWMGPNANNVDFTVNAGSVTTYGILCRAGWKDPATFSEQFTLNGGTLNMDGDAIRGWTRFDHFAEFNNGTVNSLKDWHVEQMRAVGFGGRAGGHVDFQLNDKTVNWATGLAGAADVTIRGSGTFKSGYGEKSSNLFLQGLLSGKWTVANIGTTDLSGAAVFAGGLELASNVTATVRMGGSGLVDAVYLQTDATSMNLGASLNRVCPYACNDLTTMHTYEGATFTKGQFIWQGLFYADTEGTWTFAGGYDDGLCFSVDGETVINSTNWQVITLGTKALSVGWHEFRMVQYQNGGNWGTPVSGWTKVMNLGFAKTETASTAAGDFARFDNHNLPMKPGPGAAPTRDGLVNWSSVKGYNASTWKTRTDLTSNGTYAMSSLNVYNVAATPTFAGSTHQFDGWFYVNGAQAGDWSVNVNYDDQGDLWIDGVDIGANGAKAAATVVTVPGVTPGWHQFVLRVADNTGNWGPWGNAGTCVSVTVNGTTYKFDENNFTFSATRPIEHAGLDGVVTLNPGSTLANTQTADACPIWGTLEGAGTLSGKFAFAGEDNCWVVTGAGNRRALDAVKFTGSEATALADLKKIRVTFAERPSNALYEVSEALGADPTRIVLDVKDAQGNDYTDKFTVTVVGSKLALKNACPLGVVVFIR